MPQPGGLPDISRGLRSAATIPPVSRQMDFAHPGGVPEPFYDFVTSPSPSVSGTPLGCAIISSSLRGYRLASLGSTPG